MQVADEDWLKAFGHDSSQIEPVPKTTKPKLNRAQLASKMIMDTARLRDAAPSERTLFDSIDESSQPRTQQTRS